MPTSLAATQLDSAITARNELDYGVLPVIPRFLQALDAFEDLQLHQEKHCKKQRINLKLLGEWRHSLPDLREPVVYNFLRSLSRVGVRRISEDRRDCMICQQSFTSIGGQEAVIATKMPCCSQYACSSCMNIWLRPFEAASKNTCVYCRAVLFKHLPSSETAEGLNARVDIILWSERKLRMRFNAQDQKSFETIRLALLCERVDAARQEARLHIERGFGKRDTEVERSMAQELWLRYAMIQFLAVQMQANLSNGKADDAVFLEGELLKTVDHVRQYLTYGDK